MNRYEFMEQLRRLLYDIPEKDREEALAYYEDYFDDAGTENETSVIRELGSPGKVAAEIKAGLTPDPDAGEYTDTGYHDTNCESEDQNVYSPVKRGRKRREGMDDGVKKLLIIAAIVVSFPVWGSILGALFSVLMGLMAILIAVVAGTLFGGISVVLTSLVLAVTGIVHMAVSLPLGIAVLGGGMILLAAGILLLIGFGWFTFKAIPAVVKFVLDFIGRVFHRNRKEEA